MLSRRRNDNSQKKHPQEMGSKTTYPLSASDEFEAPNANHSSLAALTDGLTGVSEEEFLVLVGFAIISLQSGTYDDLRIFWSSDTEEHLLKLQKKYPYIRLDSQQRIYDAHSCSKGNLANVFDDLHKLLILRESPIDEHFFVGTVVDVLLMKGDEERALELLTFLFSEKERQGWLLERVDKLFSQAKFFFTLNLINTLQERNERDRGFLSVIKAWTLYYLGNTVQAFEIADKVLLSKSNKDNQVFAALLLAKNKGCMNHRRLREVLEREMSHKEYNLDLWSKPELLKNYLVQIGQKESIILGYLQVSHFLRDAIRYMETCFDVEIDEDVLVILTAFFMDEVDKTYIADYSETQEGKDCVVLFHRALDLLERRCARQQNTYHDAVLYKQLSQMSKTMTTPSALSISDELSKVLAAKIAFVEDQQKIYEQTLMQKPVYEEYSLTTSGKVTNQESPTFQEEIPLLRIRLLGGLEVSIGGNPISNNLFRRHKVKTLLAILVINLGKEISRDRLSEILWPESTYEIAKRNFYGIWSLLKKALRTPSGDCPYLVRSQFCCKLEGLYVSSDVKDFEEACEKLMLSTPDSQTCARLYHEFIEHYQGDLLPSETRSPIIDQARYSHKIRMVDAFSVGAANLYERGEYLLASRFARAAIEQDNTREDAYVVLMQTQIAIGQRTAALETYLMCRRFLVDELGIDPSIQAVNLYNDIIMEESNHQNYS